MRRFIKISAIGIFLAILSGVMTDIYSQVSQVIWSTNKGTSINEGQTFTYCITDPKDSIYCLSPANKSFSSPDPGITDAVLNDGGARFNPAVAGIGNYPVSYNGKNYTFSVVSPGSPTLNPFPQKCSNDLQFTLTGGLPVDATGTYWVEGVAATTFNPTTRGPGTYSVMYSVGSTGCIAFSSIQTIKVNAAPVLTFVPPTPVCSSVPAFDLIPYASPAGGSFTGTGVSGTNFDPGAVSPGATYTVRYTYTDPVTSCTNYIDKTITVNATPSISITGLLLTHCLGDALNPFTYSPVTGAGGTGVWTGKGITDLGGGNATFNSSVAGLGYHILGYSYTSANGCSSSTSMTMRVGTDISLSGLNSQYCANDPVVTFNYSHWDPDPVNPPALPHTITITGGVGVTDLGGGKATFNPGIGVGSYTITYNYTDDLTCINTRNFNVQIMPAPNADFSGLNTNRKYCYGAADVNLTGTYTGGTFSGPAGSILDNGNGTAVFRPSALAVGTYNITYSYTNVSGCFDSETKDVEILPLPTAYTMTGGGSRCELDAGLPVSLSNSVTGTNYKLYRDGLAVVPDNIQPGSTGNPVSFGNQTIAGVYTAVATVVATGCTNAMTSNAVITVVPQSAITTQPVSTTVCEDGSASFTIQATGQNLHYKWFNDGVVVGIDNNVLVLNPVPLTDNGNEVYCEVTSTTCGVLLTSSKVILTVNPNNKILANPPVLLSVLVEA